jgi:uncharacterized DUF497 family protein
MEIVWDEPKRIANIEKHGLDFADLTFEFFLSSLSFPPKTDGPRPQAASPTERSSQSS